MMKTLMSGLFLLLFCAVVAGCADEGTVTATDGATADDIAAYEAAVAAAEQQDLESGMEEEAGGE